MELIGRIGVDSGQMMLVDPCYLSDWYANDYPGEDEAGDFSYDGACKTTLSAKSGTLFDGIAAVCSTGYGDGNYPVYVTYEDGRIASMTIIFIGDPEDQESEEEEDNYCENCCDILDNIYDTHCSSCESNSEE